MARKVCLAPAVVSVLWGRQGGVKNPPDGIKGRPGAVETGQGRFPDKGGEYAEVEISRGGNKKKKDGPLFHNSARLLYRVGFPVK